MKNGISLYFNDSGTEALIRSAKQEIERSDLVLTTAEGKISQIADTVILGLGDVAAVVLDVFEKFTEETASRNLNKQGKLTISFGISGGGNTDLKLVGAKADAFMTVQLEIAASCKDKGSADLSNTETAD